MKKAVAGSKGSKAKQRLLDIAAQADAAEGIRQGLEDLKKGRVQPARECFAEFELSMAYRVSIAAPTDAILRLEQYPNRCPTTGNRNLRHMLHGHKPHIYRIIYCVFEKQKLVAVLHIRQCARREFRRSDLK